MRGIASLIQWTEPSAVALQSGVLVIFVGAFLFLLMRLSSKENKELCEQISRKFFED